MPGSDAAAQGGERLVDGGIGAEPGDAALQPVLLVEQFARRLGLAIGALGAALVALQFLGSVQRAGIGVVCLPGPAQGVTSVAFSPDGTRLAVASLDGTTRLYELKLDDLLALAKARVTRALTDTECQQYLHGPCPANK